jgi:hypothetical protein
MTIEIHRPELEALIRERMNSGAFLDVEDIVMQSSPHWPGIDRCMRQGARLAHGWLPVTRDSGQHHTA